MLLNIIIPACIGDDIGGLISFDLTSSSTRRLLSKHWKEESKEDPLQTLKDEICTGNIMEAVERRLQQYLKQRCTQLTPSTVHIILNFVSIQT